MSLLKCLFLFVRWILAAPSIDPGNIDPEEVGCYTEYEEYPECLGLDHWLCRICARKNSERRIR